MTDRELLEKAAKAAGIKCEWRGGCFCYASTPYHIAWNPIENDQDAFRLAVRLKLDVRLALYTDRVFVDRFEIEAVEVEYNGDPYAATRRAIVRAAAALGGERAS